MKKIILIGAAALFVVAIIIRINAISRSAGKEASGVEQVYKEQGIPVQASPVMAGEFKVFCRANAMVFGIRQTEITTPVAARILKVHHQVGEKVRANEPIISLDKEDPKSSAQYRQLKAVYETTLKNYNRLLGLKDSEAIAQNQLDEMKMKLDVDKANLESVIETVRLSSPMDGTIIDLNAREGEFISPMVPAAIVAKTDRVRLIADVGETDIRCIRVGQNVLVNGGDGPGGGTGRVTKVSLTANPSTGLFRIEMEADNSRQAMRLGTYTAVRIEVVNDPGATYADVRALQEDKNGKGFVYVVRGGVARKTPVETSGMNDDFVRISSGVSPGELVVTRGFSRLDDGVRVSVSRAAASG
ncbi:MAG TPA: efflux RND transporter periplasmic adaptor subunit [Deltaproteobacteria bacterium]|nr:efflux RND transporter periplasmic adaptor subunit [Deltaproteobacteria bacterium]HQI81955.1 efflux RND transporter periplasmic adaptor subunit [Deltaproteobacteria bacterium]